MAGLLQAEQAPTKTSENYIEIVRSFSKTIQVVEYEPETVFCSMKKKIEPESSRTRVRLEGYILQFDCEMQILEELALKGLINTALIGMRKEAFAKVMKPLTELLIKEDDPLNDTTIAEVRARVGE